MTTFLSMALNQISAGLGSPYRTRMSTGPRKGEFPFRRARCRHPKSRAEQCQATWKTGALDEGELRRGRIVGNILQLQQFVDKSDCGTDAMENTTSIRRPNRLL